MKYINFENWDRREHYQFFENVDNPQYNICFHLDVTHFKKFVKENNLSFYYSMIYVSTIIMNDMEDFRYKIRDGKVILHNELKPSFTDIASNSELFKIVSMPIENDIATFSLEAKKKSENQSEFFPIKTFAEDELIYFSCLPWISFTSISNEIVMNKEDSTPRISFGKYFVDNDKLLLPYSIQVNHMLLDGIHIGEFSKKLQQYIDNL